MASVGVTYRIYYVALDYTSGLTDVALIITKPDGTNESAVLMTELDSSGVYYYDYIPATKGQYLFTVDSISKPYKFSKSLDVIVSVTSVPVVDFDE
jgi:hypothetical protein